MKKINTFNSLKDICSEFCAELPEFTKAIACRLYLVSGENSNAVVSKIYYSQTPVPSKEEKEFSENIFQVCEDLFSNNYEMEDTLEYFYNLSKEEVIIEPVIVNNTLFGYFAITGRGRDFNNENKYFIEMMTEALNSRVEVILLREDLEKRNKEKIEFLAGISHEYKTPLNSIIGFSDILKANLAGTSNYRYIDNISKSSKFLLSLIQDILDMARTEFSDMELYREVFRPKEVIEDIAYSFQEIVNSKNLHISYTITDVDIYADLRRFKQVIYNLISNAVKFNKPNGKITIISYINDKNEFVFEIKDTGDGIRKKDRGKIFNFFSQVNRNYLKRQQGSGVGLALCKKIVEAHGGEIGFKSRLNSGSTFWFTIPEQGKQ